MGPDPDGHRPRSHVRRPRGPHLRRLDVAARRRRDTRVVAGGGHDRQERRDRVARGPSRLEQKDIHVNVENGMLTIRGARQEAREANEEDYYCCERWGGSFYRTMALPAGIDPDKITATFKNGVLEVHVPKSAKALGKSIEVRAA